MSPQNVEKSERTQEAQATVQQSAEHMKEEARSAAEAQKERALRMASEQKDRAIGKVNALADALRASGEQLRQKQEGQMAEYIDRASERLDSYADMLRDRDMRDMLREARQMARRNPSLFLGGAFALGFALTRFLKSSQGEAGYGYAGESSYLARGEAQGGYAGTPGGPPVGPAPSAGYAGSGLYGGSAPAEPDVTRRPA
ncbi:hypothetical protein [Desulfocurvibacter africanus]|uniref:hypothetical protein n=1 Tax=Desulfocurvibacter africanus TaxID=873 RepID=UPI000421562F|nr:hypothetical protein [Desulfocurvibacter africanus]